LFTPTSDSLNGVIEEFSIISILRKITAGAKYLAKQVFHTVLYKSGNVTHSLSSIIDKRDPLKKVYQEKIVIEEKIGIVFHAYHLDLAKKILGWVNDFASKSPMPVEVIITTPFENVETLTKLVRGGHYKVEVNPVENRGRDIWPFLQVCQSGSFSSSALVLKIHTKAPRSIARGVKLNVDSIRELLDHKLIDALLKQAQKNPYFVATPEKYVGRTASWGQNRSNYFALIKKLKIKSSPKKLRFPAGTFFWTTGAYLEYLGTLALEKSDFLGEPSPDDGALEHALERLFGMLAKDDGGVITLEKLAAGVRNENRNPRN
jgi:lipopolysaccharide biosynthesis protein